MKKLCFIASLFYVQLSFAQTENLLTATNLENIQYPFPPRYIHLTIQGEPLQMEFMDIKADNPNGKTVVLLHGKNFCGIYWERTANELAKNGYRVIIPDQIGFGKSSKPNHIQYSFQLLAKNTKAMLDSIGGIGKIYLLGHSMGGMLAVRFALMYPEAVAKLVLEDPIGLEDWKTVVPYQNVEDNYAGELKQDYESLKQYQVTSYFHNTWKPEYSQSVDILAGWTNNIEYPRIAWNSALLTDMIFTQPVCYEFQNITAATLLIIGQNDRTAIGKERAPKNVKDKLGNYPVLGKQTMKKIPRSKLVEIPNTGHIPHLESFDLFIKPLLAFLKK